MSSALASTSSPSKAWRTTIAVLALYLLGGGLLSLAGWLADLPRFTDWFLHGISIQPNATIAVTLAGTSLIALLLNHRAAAMAIGLVVSAIGASSLFQYMAGIDLESLNKLLMFDRPWGRRGVLHAGLMGPPGATCWTFIGFAVFLCARGTPRARATVPWLCTTTLCISLLSMTGYGYGADRLYSLPLLTAIAFQTATFIAAVSIALIALVPERSPMKWIVHDGAAGRVARRVLPIIAFAPFMLGWLRLAGESAGFYDTRFGTGIFALGLTVLFVVLLISSLATIAKHETAQQGSERRLTVTLESITDGFVTIDADWRFGFINAQAARMMNVNAAKTIGETVATLFPESGGGIAQAALARAMTQRVTVEFEDFNPVTKRWFFSKVQPTEQGGLAILLQDVTERKMVATQLASDLRALRCLQALSTQLIQSDDLRLLLRGILSAAAELNGADKGDIRIYHADTLQLQIVVHEGLGSRFVEYFAEDGWDEVWGAAAQRKERVVVEDLASLDRGRPSRAMDVLKQERICAFQSTPLVSRDGRLLGILNNYFDKPRRPNARDFGYIDVLARMAADVIERAKAEQSLKDGDRRKDEFIAMLAHELRGPLAPVVYSLDLLKRVNGEDPSTLKVVAVMQRQLAHMVRLIDDLLDVSRISSGKMSLIRQRVLLETLVRQAHESCEPLLRQRGHTCTLTLPPEPVHLNSDGARIVQAIGNLLNNACKYTPPGGQIWLTAEATPTEVVLAIRDTGVGIPTEKLGTVFELFNQVGRTIEHEYGGLGIGLYLVKRVVEMHGGTIEAHSDGPNRGSKFVLRLPIGQVPEVETAVETALSVEK